MDGLVTNLAVVAGVVAAGQSAGIVRIAGVSAMLAGSLSMFVGAYVSSRARYELAHREYQRECAEVEAVPHIEKQEVQEIFERWEFPPEEAKAVTERLSKNKAHWIAFMMREELGFADEDLQRPPKRSSAIIGGAYFLGSMVPLLPFLLVAVAPGVFGITVALLVGVVLSAATLAALGAFQERFGGQRPLRGALQMASIGLAAAAVVYVITNLVFKV
jgi:vacuolar iron transporter family protein